MRFCLVAGLVLLSSHLVIGQNFEECYPTKVVSQQPAKDAQREIMELTAENVNNFIEICAPPTVKDRDADLPIGPLMRRTSEVCTEYPIDSGSTDCKARPSARYGYNAEKLLCGEFKYTGCGGNENNFLAIEECQIACEDPCNQPKHIGTSATVYTGPDGQQAKIPCLNNSGIHYYYDKSAQSCKEMRYLGCGGNKNRFESAEECKDICSLASTQVTESPMAEKKDTSVLETVNLKTLIRPTRAITEDSENCEEIDDKNVTTFCRRFRDGFPEEANILIAMDKTASDDTNSELVREMESRMVSKSVEESASLRSKGLFGFFKRPLKHTTVKIYNNKKCRKIVITIRVFCVRALINRPSLAQKTKLCNLVKAGIKKHWEVDILNVGGSLNYPVTVNVVESFFLSKKVILKWFKKMPANSNLLRSYNLGWTWFPMVMKYRGFAAGSAEDLNFMETSAHEFGHDVAMASGGLVWSWGHEGTSTIFGNTVPSTPAVPASPALINLMWYHVGGDYANYYNRVRASQQQINNLVKYATWRFIYWWCPGAIGSPCLFHHHCNPPGICSWFVCVLCNKDVQCAPGGYCKGIYIPFYKNHCEDKKANGAWCSRDAMCKSGMCDGNRCTECKENHHCPAGHYCKNNKLPFIVNQCTPKLPNGALCFQDRVCQSGFCDGGQCVECEQDGHCPAGQWCQNKNLPLVLNQCVDKLSNGALCGNDNQCSSGMCDGFQCVECEQHHHCPSHQWCKNKNIPLVLNKCTNKKCQGFCTADVQCSSGNCRWWLMCKKC